MTRLKIFPIASIALLASLLIGCGGSSSSAPPAAISVSFSPQPPSSIPASTTTTLTAFANNDNANAGVTWAVTCSGSSCGSFSPTSTFSGGATTYQAPSTPPSSGTVTVVATSVTDKTKSASASISITAAPPPVTALNDGTYVFHAAGEDLNSPYYVAGAFTVKAGVITGGEQDFLDYQVAVKDNVLASGSSVTLTSNGNIQLTLNTGDNNVGVNGVESFNATKVSSSRLLINEFDSFASGEGSVDLQIGVATPSGGYAFAVSGIDGQQQNALGIGGILNFSGGSLVTTSSIFDCNDGGTPSLGQPFTNGTVSTPDNFGRVTLTLAPNAVCASAQTVFEGYIIGPGQIQLVENGTDALGATLGGLALGQGSKTGQFSSTSVNGSTYVFSALGEDANGTLSIAGGFTFSASAPLSGDIAVNDLVAWGGSTITGGSYAVDPTGRVSLSNVAISGSNNVSPVVLGFQLYLDGNGNALELGVDGIQVSSGQAYQQTTGTFPGAGNSGLLSQGFVPISTSEVAYWSAVGPLTLTTNAFTGIVDYNEQGAALQPNISLSATVNPSTGVISLGGLDPNTQSDTYGYYPIDSSRVLAIEVDGNQIGILQIEGVSKN